MYSCLFDTIDVASTHKQFICYDDIIFINLDKLHDISFMMLISALCHEMIHYYDRMYGEYLDLFMFNLTHKNIVKDSHTTPTFKRKNEISK